MSPSPSPSPSPPPHLATLVSQKYSAAQASSHLLFSPTTLTTIPIASIPFQLRYCPALSQKPILPTSPSSSFSPQSTNPSSKPRTPTEKPDPFASPAPELLIARLPPHEPSHVLVLNKYPVIAQHFILATAAWAPQTDLLGEGDLAATFACLRAWGEGAGDGDDDDDDGTGAGAGAGVRATKRLFAFFNSGPHSGASQPHRHVQFLPAERMRNGADAPGSEPGWSLLVDRMAAGVPVGKATAEVPTLRHLPGLPFAHFALPLSPDASPADLHARYRRLYDAAVASCRVYAGRYPDEKVVVGQEGEGEDREGKAVISYNLALTTDAMAICPRRREGAMVRDGLGPVAINGTVLGGTVMVKTGEEWDALRRGGDGLFGLLKAVGIPVEYGVGNENGRL